ncbi:hypothetical protein RFI_02394 [Reticulomyxa filosa]|uniref:WD repeat and FYVE domain-containing protein 3 n=1 Tax=Reticulomyxa filosa TaxID=46433 RepID=X6P834_RETFI|nr:hypothetical protein RFI_02394 [Reticulomyxa filosa]|eukprot:ETO34695.1 hypothetical protein RFI_02394 [Reticulomyxa filosa]
METKQKEVLFTTSLDVTNPSLGPLALDNAANVGSNPSNEGTTEDKEPLRFTYDSIREVYKRQYQLQQIAIEFFLFDGSNFLLIFSTRSDRNQVFQEIENIHSFREKREKERQETGGPKMEPESPSNDILDHISAANNRSTIKLVIDYLSRSTNNITIVTKRWENGQISNFAYLMFLNTLAGRSYNDITQYPVFPWILSDYESESLNLANPAVYRDLTKPMGAQTEPRASEFKQRYETWEDPSGVILPFHYGSHYSSPGIVLYFLIRLEPFTKFFLLLLLMAALELQDGKFDHPERLFSSIPCCWQLASETGGMQDVKELIPEFFYSSHFLSNINRFNFQRTEKEISIDDVILPNWACGDPERFIRLHRDALESPYVSQHLHHWIDLIFGYKQRGKIAVDALNVFYYLSYEGAVDLETIESKLEKEATITQINNFGQVFVLIIVVITPKQLFTKPHPQRKMMRPLINVYTQPDLLDPIEETKTENGESVTYLNISSEMRPVYSMGREVLLPPQFNYSLAWGFSDQSLRLLFKGKPVTTFEDVLCVDDGQVTCVLTSEDGVIIFIGDTVGVVSICKLRTESRKDKRRPPQGNLALRSRLYGHSDEITCLAHNKDYRILVSGSKDNTVIIWDFKSAQLMHRLEGHMQRISCVAIHNVTGIFFFIFFFKMKIKIKTHTNGIYKQKKRDGCLRFWSLVIPNGPKEITEHRYTANSQKTSFDNVEDNSIGNINKQFAPKLPSYQKKRATPDVNLFNFNSQCYPESKSTSLKQLYGDTTLRFKHMCTKSNKHTHPITQIYASRLTHQYLWTSDASGVILQWEIRKKRFVPFFFPFSHNQSLEEHWAQDKDVLNCSKCNVLFGLIERKHHCRKCGKIFCKNCSSNKTALPEMGFGEPVRVCNFCWDKSKGQEEFDKLTPNLLTPNDAGDLQ